MTYRLFTLFFITFCSLWSLTSAPLQAEEKAESNDPFKDLTKNSKIGSDMYEHCLQSSTDDTAEAFQKCLNLKWGTLTPGQKEELAQDLQSVEVTFDSEGNQVRKPSKIEKLNVSTLSESFASKNDPAVVALRQYLKEQLSNSLYGDLPTDKITKRKFVDHAAFYTMFETQVGQNIILALSNYCMRSNMHMLETIAIPSERNKWPDFKASDPSGWKQFTNSFLILEGDDTANMEKNLENLKNKFGDAATRTNQQQLYNLCIESIPKICHNGHNASGEAPSGLSARPPATTPPTVFMKKDACLVTEYLGQARQALMNVDAIKKEIEKQAKENSGNNLRLSEVEQNAVYSDGDNENEKSIRQLAIVTSTDLQNAKTKEASVKAAEALTECESTGDETICGDYISADINDKKELLTQEFLKSKAQGERLKLALSEDPSQAQTYLIEEGHTEEEAQAILDEHGEANIISKITNRYELKKSEVIESLAKEIDKSSIAEGGDFSAKARAINNQVSTQSDTLVNVLHFANLSSSYLTITVENSDAPSTANTLAAFSELNGDSVNTSRDRSPSNQATIPLYEGSEDLLEKGKEVLETLQKDAPKEEGTGATFGVDQINKLLDYN